MLNVLGLEPWVIAEQPRHSDGGALVVELTARAKLLASDAAS